MDTEQIIKRCKEINKDIQDIIQYALDVQKDELPKSFLPADDQYLQKNVHGQKAYKILQVALRLYDKNNKGKNINALIDYLSDELSSRSLNLKVNKTGWSIELDGLSYHFVIEIRHIISVYIYNGNDLQQSIIIHDPLEFSFVIRIAEQLRALLSDKDPDYQGLNTLIEKISKIGDEFCPDWRDIHQRPLKTNRIMDRIYIAESDVEDIRNSIRIIFKTNKIKVVGNGSESLEGLLTQLLGNPDVIDSIMNSDGLKDNNKLVELMKEKPDIVRIITDEKMIEMMKKIFSPYTIRNKLNKLQSELKCLQNSFKTVKPTSDKPLSINRVKQYLINNKQDEFLAIDPFQIQQVWGQLQEFLSSQTDQFIRQRAELILNGILNGLIVGDKELMGRIITLIMSSNSVYGLEKEHMDVELKQQLNEAISDEARIQTIIENQAELQEIGNKLGEAFYQANREEIENMLNTVSDADLPERFAEFFEKNIDSILE